MFTRSEEKIKSAAEKRPQMVLVEENEQATVNFTSWCHVLRISQEVSSSLQSMAAMSKQQS